MNEELKKRTWHYVHLPVVYEISCDKCGGTNTTWSEYEGHIWCRDCNIDTKGTAGIFDGPIPIGLCGVLGISFDRWDMEKKIVVKFEEWSKQ